MLLSCKQPTIRPGSGDRSRAVRVQAGPVYSVTLVQPNGKEYTFRAGNSKSIYDIASYAGIHLPASCKVGSCSACCSRVLEGHVKQSNQTCVPQELVKEGFVALCCSVPTSDVKILTHQGVAVRKWKSEQPLKSEAPAKPAKARR